jgi:hypothetical protein
MKTHKTTNSSQKFTRIFSAVIATTTLALGNVPNAQAASFSFSTGSISQNTFSNTLGTSFSFTNNTGSIVQNALMNAPSSASSSTGGCMFADQSVGGLTQSSSMCAPTRSQISISIPGSSSTGVDGSDWKAKMLADLAEKSESSGSNQNSTQTVSQTNNNIQTVSSNSTQINQTSTQTQSSTSSQISQSVNQTIVQTGTTQTNPILPNFIGNGMFSFTNVRSGLWFDPPTAYGFRYSMTDGSLFTDILNFPTGFNTPFTVAVGDTILGNFTAGQSVNFNNYSPLLGNLLIGDAGVSEFSVLGLNVDPTNPEVFPIQLQFNTETASFGQMAIFEPPTEAEDVPEPSTLLGSIFGFTAMAGALRRRVTTRK